jgi:hypothetical protein
MRQSIESLALTPPRVGDPKQYKLCDMVSSVSTLFRLRYQLRLLGRKRERIIFATSHSGTVAGVREYDRYVVE